MKIISSVPNTTYVTGLSLADFAAYLKMTLADDTTVITLCYNAAVEYIQGLTWRNITGRVVNLIGDSWSDGEFEIEIAGVLSSMTVNYYDTDNTSQTLTLDPSEYFLERTGQGTSILHIKPDTYPGLYDRKDAIRVSMTLTGSDTSSDKVMQMLICQIGAYFYDCRVNEKEPQVTVVEKIASSIRMREF